MRKYKWKKKRKEAWTSKIKNTTEGQISKGSVEQTDRKCPTSGGTNTNVKVDTYSVNLKYSKKYNSSNYSLMNEMPGAKWAEKVNATGRKTWINNNNNNNNNNKK